MNEQTVNKTKVCKYCGQTTRNRSTMCPNCITKKAVVEKFLRVTASIKKSIGYDKDGRQKEIEQEQIEGMTNVIVNSFTVARGFGVKYPSPRKIATDLYKAGYHNHKEDDK